MHNVLRWFCCFVFFPLVALNGIFGGSLLARLFHSSCLFLFHILIVFVNPPGPLGLPVAGPKVDAVSINKSSAVCTEVVYVTVIRHESRCATIVVSKGVDISESIHRVKYLQFPFVLRRFY